MHFLVVALAAALVPAAASAQTKCPLEEAHYVLRDEPTVTARFQDIRSYPGWLSNVALNVHFGKNRDGFWWLFDEGSARFLNMISTTDLNKAGWTPPSETNGGQRPLGETHVWFASGSYQLSYLLPKQRQMAPQHIFIPDLEELMWYRAEPRREVSTAFFDLVTCK